MSNKCATCLFREKEKCVWLDQAISSTPICGGHHWMQRPDHMYLPPEDRVFPFQLEDMTPEERKEAEEVMATAKKKTLKMMAAFLLRLGEQEEAARKDGWRLRWVRNFLNWKLSQHDFVPEENEVYQEERMAA